MSELRIPILVITGFLGSGKTTVINHLLTLPSMANSVVLVNEFGQIDIDTDLIQHSSDTVVQLTNGCICCSLKDDLATTLSDLLQQRKTGDLPRFARVLIETTGLANAGPIIQVVMEDPLVSDDFVLSKVITTVDAVNGVYNLNIHAESVEQVAVADWLIMTKLDRLDSPEQKATMKQLRERLLRLNPAVQVLDADNGKIDSTKLFNESTDQQISRFTNPITWQSSWTPTSDHSHDHQHAHDSMQPLDQAISHNHSRHDQHIRAFCIMREQAIPLSVLEHFWAVLSAETGPNLLRIKGIIQVAERPDNPAVVHGVQTLFDDIQWLDRWPSSDHRSRIVFIGWQIDQQQIEQLLIKAHAGYSAEKT